MNIAEKTDFCSTEEIPMPKMSVYRVGKSFSRHTCGGLLLYTNAKL